MLLLVYIHYDIYFYALYTLEYMRYWNLFIIIQQAQVDAVAPMS